MRRCKYCKYKVTETQGGGSYCHCLPPTVTSLGEGRFQSFHPPVHDTMGCGFGRVSILKIALAVLAGVYKKVSSKVQQ